MSGISSVGGASYYQASQNRAAATQQALAPSVANAKQAVTQAAAPKANDGDADDRGGFNKLA